MTLPENLCHGVRLGAHPDDIILALRAITKRLKYNQRKAADYAANREWHRNYNQYRYSTG